MNSQCPREPDKLSIYDASYKHSPLSCSSETRRPHEAEPVGSPQHHKILGGWPQLFLPRAQWLSSCRENKLMARLKWQFYCQMQRGLPTVPKIPASHVVALTEPYFLMPHSTAWQPKRKLQNSKKILLHPGHHFMLCPSSVCPGSPLLCLPACEGATLPSSDTVCTPARVPFLILERKNSPLPGNCSPNEAVLKKFFYRNKFTIPLFVSSPKKSEQTNINSIMAN